MLNVVVVFVLWPNYLIGHLPEKAVVSRSYEII